MSSAIVTVALSCSLWLSMSCSTPAGSSCMTPAFTVLHRENFTLQWNSKEVSKAMNVLETKSECSHVSKKGPAFVSPHIHYQQGAASGRCSLKANLGMHYRIEHSSWGYGAMMLCKLLSKKCISIAAIVASIYWRGKTCWLLFYAYEFCPGKVQLLLI